MVKFPKIFGGKEEKQEKTRTEQLEKLGISVQRSDELEKRVTKINELHALIRTRLEAKEIEEGMILSDEEKLWELWKKDHKIDLLMREASVPWGRAGDVDWYREVMLGWELLHAYGKVMIKGVHRILATGEERELMFIDKKDLLANLEDFLIVEVWLYALYITDASYFREDISPAYLITLQQQVAGHSGPYPQPGSMQFPTER